MIEEYLELEVNEEIARSIAELAFEAFDSAKTVEQRVDEIVASANSQSTENSSSRRFVIRQDGRLIAHARTFVRTIKANGTELDVLALASVCTRLDCRGQGLGAKVVRKTFEQIEQPEWPEVSLFQTPVPVFYEKLGCRVVDNPFVNGLDTQNPTANPWRDDVIMIYPNQFNWPKGTIDLNGPDY